MELDPASKFEFPNLDVDGLAHFLNHCRILWFEEQIHRMVAVAQQEGLTRDELQECTTEAVSRLKWPTPPPLDNPETDLDSEKL